MIFRPPARRFTQFFKKEVASLFQSARSILKNDVIMIKIAKKREDTGGKLLIIIPKKVGHAPYRNYLRRCAKEIFRQNKLHLHHLRWIISFKANNQKLTFSTLTTYVQDALKLYLNQSIHLVQK